jgi:two-component system sensor histidine kinase NblS
VLSNIKKLFNSVNYSWQNFKLQTQIILATTLLISILVSSIASWSVTAINEQLTLSKNQYTNDMNLLLSNNLDSLLKDDKKKEIISFCEGFYENTPNIRFILFIDNYGSYYGIPYNYDEIFSLNPKLAKNLTITKKKLLNSINEENSGFILIGNDSNPNIFNNLLITNEIIFIIFIIFWIILILSIMFNRVTIILPLKELSQSFKSIGNGNFSKRIALTITGELRELILSFNEMGRSLQLYEEKNKEQLLNEKIRLESLITTIADGTVLLDTNLKIVLVNTAAIKFFGWKIKTRLIGTSIWDHLPINLQKKMFMTLQKMLINSNSAMFYGEFSNEVVQLPKKYVRIILNIIYDSQGRNKIPIGIGLTLQDTTKELELDKTQNRFMSNISHELRTPLFNIKSFIETIEEYDYTLSSWQKRYFLGIINKETNRLARLVNDILCISKLDSIKNISLNSMDLIETFNQTVANCQITAHDKDLYLHTELSFNKTIVKGNKDLLLQVLINLVGNALKFTYNKGEIIIRAYQIGEGKSNKIRIEIADTGIGIVYDYQEDIFQRFYRIENNVHTLKGTGLGLSIVKTILLQHNTIINVISRYNVGSVFWFDLTTNKL